MSGAIHWKVNKLRKLALYSLDTTRSFGTGGFLDRLSGFSRLYHGFFCCCWVLLVAVLKADIDVAVVSVL